MRFERKGFVVDLRVERLVQWRQPVADDVHDRAVDFADRSDARAPAHDPRGGLEFCGELFQTLRRAEVVDHCAIAQAAGGGAFLYVHPANRIDGHVRRSPGCIR